MQTYTMVLILFKSNTYTMYNLSFYYQIINLLNTKNNILIITIITIFLINTCYKNIDYFLVITALILFYFNLLSGDIYKGLFQILGSGISTPNTNLLNGLMLIHPIILYLFYIFSFEKLYLFSNFKNHTKFKIQHPNKRRNDLLIYSSYSALVLGCCWAEQELSWGGWWS